MTDLEDNTLHYAKYTFVNEVSHSYHTDKNATYRHI